MSSQVIPGVLAVLGGVVLAGLLFVPFVFRSYRRRGEVGFGPALLAFGFVVYGLAILTYTLLPLPQIDAAWCAQHEALTHPQLNPLQFVDDIRKERSAPGLHGFLANPAVQQLVLNIALFVPLGAYLRHQFGRGVLASIAIGFGVSVLVEFTQLTGNWFLFPCPYRIFDIDDVLTNTLGTGVGVLLAPVLGLISGRHRTLPADAPRPVTTGRRLLGMLVDLVMVGVLGGVLVVGMATIMLLTGGPTEGPLADLLTVALSSWVPAILLLGVPMLFGPGDATLGQQAVRLRWVGPEGGRPGGRKVVSLLTGAFGYFVLSGLGTWVPFASFLAGALLVLTPIAAWRSRGHRGLAGRCAGLLITDSRAAVHTEPVESTRQHRRG